MAPPVAGASETRVCALAKPPTGRVRPTSRLSFSFGRWPALASPCVLPLLRHIPLRVVWRHSHLGRRGQTNIGRIKTMCLAANVHHSPMCTQHANQQSSCVLSTLVPCLGLKNIHPFDGVVARVRTQYPRVGEGSVGFDTESVLVCRIGRIVKERALHKIAQLELSQFG